MDRICLLDREEQAGFAVPHSSLTIGLVGLGLGLVWGWVGVGLGKGLGWGWIGVGLGLKNEFQIHFQDGRRSVSRR